MFFCSKVYSVLSGLHTIQLPAFIMVVLVEESPDNQLGCGQSTQEMPATPELSATQELPATQEFDAQKILDAQKQAEEREQFKDPPQEADASGACLAVEQFDWKQLKVGPKNYCANCKRPVDAEPTFVVRKKGHQRMACKMCHNVTSMLYKKMDMKAVGFKDLSQVPCSMR